MKRASRSSLRQNNNNSIGELTGFRLSDTENFLVSPRKRIRTPIKVDEQQPMAEQIREREETTTHVVEKAAAKRKDEQQQKKNEPHKQRGRKRLSAEASPLVVSKKTTTPTTRIIV